MRQPTGTTKARRWMITLNNPTDEEKVVWERAYKTNQRMRYLIYQLEKGERETKHFQGYVEFRSCVRMNGVKAIFGQRVHVDKCRGNSNQCKTYCSKEDTREEGPWEHGFRAKGDLDRVVHKLVKENKKPSDIAEEDPIAFAKHSFKIKELFNQRTKHRNWAMEILIYYGTTGSGKSYTANKDYPDAYNAPWPTGGRWWWPKYEGQETVILDEFRHQIKFDMMLKLMDRYALWLESKGSNMKFRSKRIVITTNIDPKDWYPGMEKEKKSMLKRRIQQFSKLYKFRGTPTMDDDGNLQTTKALVPTTHFEFEEKIQPATGFTGLNFSTPYGQQEPRTDEDGDTTMRESYNRIGGIPTVPQL